MAETTYLPEVRCQVTPGGILPNGVNRLWSTDSRSGEAQIDNVRQPSRDDFFLHHPDSSAVGPYIEGSGTSLRRR